MLAPPSRAPPVISTLSPLFMQDVLAKGGRAAGSASTRHTDLHFEAVTLQGFGPFKEEVVG